MKETAEVIEVEIEKVLEEVTEDRLPDIPAYSVSGIPEHEIFEKCEKDIVGAKSMKDLRAVARQWKVKRYKGIKAKDRSKLEDMIRERAGVIVGLEMFQEKLAGMTAEDIQKMVEADESPVPQQRDELLGVDKGTALTVVEPEVIEAEIVDDSNIDPEKRYELALSAMKREHDSILFHAADIAKPFLNALKDQEWSENAWDDFNKEREEYVSQVLSNEADREDPSWNTTEIVTLVQEAFKALNDVAPDGFFFGLDNTNQQRGFGFWLEKPVDSVNEF